MYAVQALDQGILHFEMSTGKERFGIGLALMERCMQGVQTPAMLFRAMVLL